MPSVCLNCGNRVRPESRFCQRCGQPLDGRLGTGFELNNGHYRIVRSLTKGGMGAVYLAEDRGAFDRLCVVKQMLAYYDASDPEERQRAEERFQEEGRTLASLSHPGIPKIYAFFQEHGRFYIVMEYIQGEDLESFVTHQDTGGRMVYGRRLPQEEVIRHTIGVCQILEYLHSQPRPVVHQDIKPANIVLEHQLGEVRLLDFGTARAGLPARPLPQERQGRGGRRSRESGRDARAPENGNGDNGSRSSIFGTDGYAPPEQYRGNPVPRSDVFALAATAYHLLTDDDPRDHPFKWPKLESLPRELQSILGRALRNAPEQRPTARELHQSLETLSNPQRSLQAFTFPGGTRIRTVAALAPLCDEHWDASRAFLRNGDFQRWLRDINRHDLVVAADEIVKQEKNRDRALERFLNVVDPGLPQPKIATDPPAVELGAIARESALVRKVTALNITRGYTLATVRASQPWIEIYPETLHLWAGIPADIRVNVRAENLPFRSQQRGTVRIEADGIDPVEVPVTARVSLTREAWRLLWRTISAALPESWRAVKTCWSEAMGITAAALRPLWRYPWLVWVVWLVGAIGLGMALYAWQPGPDAGALGRFLQPPADWTTDVPPTWFEVRLALFYILQGLLAIPLLLPGFWLVIFLTWLFGAALWGAARGAWKSLFR